ncbi:MAG TPA: hypothetical protein VH619_09930 [Verrucomicrobiae bacterium]|jgi:hypothetical protein|nr:hypothetical protein [Verrucomicrobiae bacterium]
MKNQFTPTKITFWPGLKSALAGLLLMGIAASASPAEVLPPSSLPYGYSYEEWSAKYWQWTLGQSTNHYETLGDPGVCSGPASRVRFPGPSVIGGDAIHVETNHITIADGTPLFFPVFCLWEDNGNCPLSAFTTFTAAQLATFAEENWSATTETSCTIDGVAVPGMKNPTNSVYNVISPPFSYTTAEKDNVLAGALGATCVPGDFTIYPAVADGVYVMLAPLSPGKHTIHTVGVIGPLDAPLAKSDRTIEITVLPRE